MGVLAKLFGVVPQEEIPQLVSIFPDAAKNKVKSGKLPTIIADRIILSNGEICHFVDVSAAITEKKRRQTVHAGGSYHLFKGYTAHLGQSQSVAVPESHFTKGVLYITNQRIIFTARENCFDKKIKALTAMTPYTDGISLQFGSKTYTLLLPDGTVAYEIINMLI